MRPAEAEAALRAARTTRHTLAPFTDAEPALDEKWGYDVQALDRAHRAERGERVVGAKLGLTSAAKQQRMNVDQPVVGFLTHAMQQEPAGLAGAIGSWTQPRIEPEIAFITGRPIASPVTLAESARVIDAVTVAAEILDSRYDGYRFRLPDVVADNTSAAGYLLGALLDPSVAEDLARVRCRLAVDGTTVHEATGAAILGDPLRSIVLLSEHLARRGEVLPAGSLVLAGALTDAVPLVAGSRYTIEMGELGSLSV
ncbi:MAG TPA: fumarylacetoacetate hydrolase family protein [Nocardioides sp.]|nr:fumarylacetoacetate hydrolase family protein [Nocardioides sp.]